MTRPRRILLGGAALLALAVGGGAWLVGEALRGEEALAAERHLVVAARVFDELERELSTLVEREEARSFLEYRYFYVVDAAAVTPEIATSPLATAVDPRVVGWFQLDPDGSVRTPRAPADNERELAAERGWDGVDRDVELRRILSGAAPWALARPEDRAEPPGDLLWNRGAEPRWSRYVQVVTTRDANLVAYEQDALACQDAGDRPVDVDVAPMSGARLGDHLVLSRTVRSGGQEWRQGLVLYVPALQARLEDALEDSALGSVVTLAWDAAADPAGRYHADHVFAPPFGSLRLSVGVAPVAELAGSRGVVGLALALLAALVVGGAALAWAVRAELEFAARRSAFVAAVSHELRTPLTTIRLYGEMLRDDMVPDAARRRDYHATITNEAERLSRLIGNVLALARLERPGPRPVVEVGALGPVVREALEVVRPHATAQGFELALREVSGLPAVRFERDGVLQIVVNLVDNAVKFGASGDRRVEVALVPRGAGVALTVRDRGAGVPEAELERVFEPFFRGERELPTTGTGMGLALVHAVAGAMGARVDARNHPDGGFEVEAVFGT